MDKNLNTGSRKHDVVWLPRVPAAHLIQQRAGLERLHQFACDSSKFGAICGRNISSLFSVSKQVETGARAPSVHSQCVIGTRHGHLAIVLVLSSVGLWGQIAPPAEPIDFRLYNEPPRLLLTGQRLRLLRRERERQSQRWEQFSALMQGHARMPEPGFALALDWCAPQLDAAARAALRRRLLAALAGRPRDAAALRSAVFAALAAFDAGPDAAQALLRYAVEDWWRRQTVPRLRAGEDPFPDRAALLALIEIVHVVRDNFQVDLRADAVEWFNELPPRLMLAYYPAPWPAPENDYRIPAYKGSGDPDLDQSVLSRAAELALVAADPNAQPISFLQGWLMQDQIGR